VQVDTTAGHQRLAAENPMGVDFIKMLLSTAEQTGKLKKSETARTLQVPGKWLLHFCHDFASVMRDLAKMSKT
jgi:hypothetical protein